MGGGPSREEIKHFVRSEIPLEQFEFKDLVLDNCLKEFSGLQSNKVLKEKSEFLFKNSPAKIRDFVNQAKGLTGFPNAVGIGAFFILLMMEASLGDDQRESLSTTLNHMFATEKGNDVLNIVQAYYERFTMFFHDLTKLLKETKKYERRLGDQLVTVRNTLRGGNMSTALFKVWVNGAAFHVQMLIHLVRLEGGDRRPVRSAITHYQRKLGELVNEFKKFKINQFDLYETLLSEMMDDRDKIREIKDCESNKISQYHVRGTDWVTPEILAEVLFEQDEYIPRLIQDFSEIQQNMDDLIDLNDDFAVVLD